jgi:hypothetical protein
MVGVCDTEGDDRRVIMQRKVDVGNRERGSEDQRSALLSHSSILLSHRTTH